MVEQKATIPTKCTKPHRRIALWRGSFMLWNGENLDFMRFSGIEKAHRNSIKITVDLWRSRRDSNPWTAFDRHTISSRARYDLFDTAPYAILILCGKISFYIVPDFRAIVKYFLPLFCIF